MKIFRAIGWGLFFVIFRNVMPDVFDGFRQTLVMLFHVMQNGLLYADSVAQVINH